MVNNTKKMPWADVCVGGWNGIMVKGHFGID